MKYEQDNAWQRTKTCSRSPCEMDAFPIARVEEEWAVSSPRGRSSACCHFQFSHWKGSQRGPWCRVSKVVASAAGTGVGACGGAKEYGGKEGSSCGVAGFSCPKIAVGYSAELRTCLRILLACTSIASAPRTLLSSSTAVAFPSAYANECLSSPGPEVDFSVKCAHLLGYHI